MTEPDNAAIASTSTSRAEPIIDHPDVLRMLAGDYELGVSWAPRHRPVVVLAIRVNAQKTAANEVDDESPFIVPKLPPAAEGRYRVAWAISPVVAIDAIVIAIRNRVTGELAVVGRVSDLKANQLWQNPGVDVHAP